MVAAATVAAAAISTAGSVASSSAASAASGKAAKAQNKAAAQASNADEKSNTQSERDIAPYKNAGVGATNQLSYLLGINPAKGSAVSLIPDKIYNALNAVRNKSPNMGDFDESGLIRSIKTYAENPDILKSFQDSSQYQLDKSLTQQDFIDALNQINSQGGTSSNTAFADVNKGMGDYGSLTKRFSLDDYEADPGYQFRLDQGNKAIAAQQAKRGNFYSGAALKEADAYNSNQASQEYGNAYNRYTADQNNLYSRLAGVSNQGMGAANTSINMNQDNASAISNIYGQAGNANAANSIAQSNALNQGIGTGISALNSGISSYAKSPSYSNSYVGPGGSNIWGSAYGSAWNNPDSIWS